MKPPRRRKAIPKAVRERVAERQQNRCANEPGASAVGCKRYACPLWAATHHPDSKRGAFDEAGFEIDHIVEVSHGGADDAENLQALCPSCHRVKTLRFSHNRCMFTSPDLHQGRCLMECDAPPPRKIRVVPTPNPTPCAGPAQGRRRAGAGPAQGRRWAGARAGDK